MSRVCFIALSLLVVVSCWGDASDNQPSPKSPLESLDCIRVPPGFRVEIVATEPLIESPVAFEWGADGKLWVVEMRDYPGGNGRRGGASAVVETAMADETADEVQRRDAAATFSFAPAVERTPLPNSLPASRGEGIARGTGRIVFLEDTKGDGVYDKATVFLDGLSYPNGLCPWRKGVIVSAGGEIFYAFSTNGNGKADVRKTILSGFSLGNPQHRVNGFDYGLDNWLYAANGDSGGRIRSFAGGGVTVMGGCDLRFRPDTGEFDLQAGTSQYGRHRDDWGNWFGNHNVTWLWHYYVPLQYLRRNPHLFVRDLKQDTAQYPHARLAFPISPPMPRFNEPADTNQVTAGCSPMPYRDDLFPKSLAMCLETHQKGGPVSDDRFRRRDADGCGRNVVSPRNQGIMGLTAGSEGSASVLPTLTAGFAADLTPIPPAILAAPRLWRRMAAMMAVPAVARHRIGGEYGG
jgi:hypothetical protein